MLIAMLISDAHSGRRVARERRHSGEGVGAAGGLLRGTEAVRVTGRHTRSCEQRPTLRYVTEGRRGICSRCIREIVLGEILPVSPEQLHTREQALPEVSGRIAELI